MRIILKIYQNKIKAKIILILMCRKVNQICRVKTKGLCRKFEIYPCAGSKICGKFNERRQKLKRFEPFKFALFRKSGKFKALNFN